MQRDTWSKNRVTRRRTTSGSLAETSEVESTRSTNRTVASLRSIRLSLETSREAGLFRSEGSLWPPHQPLGFRAVLDPKVFKAYDVRGIYPAEIDEEGVRAIGRAYVEQF